MRPHFLSRLRSLFTLSAVFLLIEFFDETHYAIAGAALPAIQTDLHLNYAQVGLLLGLPHILGSGIEWIIMLLGDTRLRKVLVVGGGLAIAAAVMTTSASTSFYLLLGAAIVSFPASGAFVTLAQATLIDLHPQREEQMMARWTLAGSAGNLVGPLILAGIFALGLSWRWGYGLLGAAALLLVTMAARSPFPAQSSPAAHPSWQAELGSIWQGAMQAVTNLELLRWMFLLEMADLLMDVFNSYTPLYFTNVVGLDNTQASLMLGGMMLTGLLADALAIPLLERFPGRTLIRMTAAAAVILFAGFLLAPWLPLKIGLVMLVKMTTLGWYAIMKGETYAAVPGKSGTLNAINSVSSLISGAIPWVLGLAAERMGLHNAMWLLIVGPVCLLLWTPKAARKS